MSLAIRTFQSGDEASQAHVYNTAAAKLPAFKPATSEDIRRRSGDSGFDPETRIYAVASNQIVGYCTVQPNGRISFPWCLPEHNARAWLFDAALAKSRAMGLKQLFAAYRADWTEQTAFFEANGFHKSREYVNFAQSLLDLPTMVIRRGLNVSPLKDDDLPAILALAPQLLRVSLDQARSYFFANRYFSVDSLFVLRKGDGSPQGVGLLISNPDYANPMMVDSATPCFRLGAFGTEGMTTKRINGLFSFLVGDERDASAVGLDLLSYALHRVQDDTIEVLAAQAPSDAKHLLGFYQKYFRKQGSFPVYERELNK